MKNKSIFALFIILLIVSITMCFRVFENQDSGQDTVQKALSFGAFESYEIPTEIIDEIKLDNDTIIAIYLTDANTIGIAYIDCSDSLEYKVIEKRSMPIIEINKNKFLNSHFYEYRSQTVYYSFSSENTNDNKKYTVKLNNNINYSFYFSCSR